MQAVHRLSPDAAAAFKNGSRGNEPIPVASAVRAGVATTPEETGPQYLPPLPSFDVRLVQWLIRQVMLTGRVKRLLLWLPTVYLQTRSFLKAWSWGRKVSMPAYNLRMIACDTCPAKLVRIYPMTHKDGKPGYTGKEYCGRCGCPEWRLSELQVKNKMVGWKCPLRRHEGTYGDETYRHLISNQGCSSCGGAS